MTDDRAGSTDGLIRHGWRRLWTYSRLSRTASALLLVVGIVAVSADLFLPRTGEDGGPDVAAALVAISVVLFVWRPPIAALALVIGLGGAILAGTMDVWLLGMGVATGVAVLTLSKPLATGYVCVTFVALALGEAMRPETRGAEVIAVAVLVTLASSTGGLVARSARARQEVMVRRLLVDAGHADAARRQERQRIADEMHDFIAHELTIIVMHARVLRGAVDEQERSIAQAAIESAASQALADIRRMVAESPDAHISPSGWRRSLRATLDATTKHLEGIGVRSVVDVSEQLLSDLAPTVDTGLAHIVQESVSNVVKHSPGASRVAIAASRGVGSITLTIANDGEPSVSAGPRPGGYGLARMRERAGVLGGSLAAGPTSDGWLVEVEVSLR